MQFEHIKGPSHCSSCLSFPHRWHFAVDAAEYFCKACPHLKMSNLWTAIAVYSYGDQENNYQDNRIGRGFRGRPQRGFMQGSNQGSQGRKKIGEDHLEIHYMVILLQAEDCSKIHNMGDLVQTENCSEMHNMVDLLQTEDHCSKCR